MSTEQVIAVRSAIDAMAGLLTVATGLAGAGRKVDLAGLDTEMARLCAATLALAPGDGRGVRAALIALVAELDQLSATLRTNA